MPLAPFTVIPPRCPNCGNPTAVTAHGVAGGGWTCGTCNHTEAPPVAPNPNHGPPPHH